MDVSAILLQTTNLTKRKGRQRNCRGWQGGSSQGKRDKPGRDQKETSGPVSSRSQLRSGGSMHWKNLHEKKKMEREVNAWDQLCQSLTCRKGWKHLGGYEYRNYFSLIKHFVSAYMLQNMWSGYVLLCCFLLIYRKNVGSRWGFFSVVQCLSDPFKKKKNAYTKNTWMSFWNHKNQQEQHFCYILYLVYVGRL